MCTHRVRVSRACFVGLLGAGLLFAGAPAFARNNTTAPSWISLEQQPAGAVVGQWQPALGDLVTFASSSPNTVKNPRIEVLCFQSSVLVYGEAGSADQAFQQQLTGYPGFVLGGSSSVWLRSGGPADCTANLFYFGWVKGQQTYNLLATTTFAATG